MANVFSMKAWGPAVPALALACLLAGPAGAVEFQITADTFTVSNQLDVSSVSYFQGQGTAPGAPGTATQLASPGGLWFDGTYYQVWNSQTSQWVRLATGTVAGDGTRVARTGDGMTGPLTVSGASVTVVDGNVGSDAFSLAATTAADRSVYHLLVSTRGYVGIGTKNPTQRLEILNGNVQLHRNDGGRPVYWIAFDNIGTAYFLGIQNDGRLHLTSYAPTDNFDPNTGVGINMTASGNVGLGVASPAYALDVNGGAGFRSSTTWAGTAAPAASAAGQGGIYFDSGANKFKVSESGGGYVNLVGAGSSAGGWTESAPGVALASPGDNVTVQSTLTVQGSGFSVGGVTLVATGGNVGVGTASPATLLDANGSAQFGAGAAKSTFTAAGNLQLVSGSIVTSNGTLSISTAASAALTGLPALFVDNAGRVGVETASPGYPLSVVGTIGVAYSTAAGDVKAALGPLSNGAQLVLYGASAGSNIVLDSRSGNSSYFNNSGSLGVGTNNPATTVEVNGSAQFGANAAKSTFTAAGNLQLVSGSTLASNGTLSISTAASAALTGTPALFIDNAGRVGVGAMNPVQKLDVMGNMVAHMSGTDDRLVFNPLAAGSGSNIYVSNSAGSAYQPLAFQAASFGFTQGSVGVGTASPATLLDANGSAQFGANAAKSTFTAAGNLQLVTGSTLTSNGTLSISTAASAALTGTPALFINNAGKVGVGTPSPDSTVSINDPGDGSFALKIRRTAAGGNVQGLRLVSNGDGSTINYRSADLLLITPAGGTAAGHVSLLVNNALTEPSVGATEAMTWMTNGNVGVLNPTPQYRLDVQGDIRATGSVYYGGTTGAADGTLYTKPDFVFAKGYKVRSTGDVEEFLRREGHLPWLTSLKREKEEHRGVVDMTRMAFETVETAENLQLQLVALAGTVKALEAENVSLRARLGRLEAGKPR